ncbi:restriction endonuclease [Mycobacterium sp. 1274756.6]|uniref:restriction endonuclease n=1 Tax=Mycobacterium sp. 1274756.6 TaxID=1834076 RepID=UPI000A813D31|nr:restriction endonuclease [Mycobacterium sp. 1274756.6]
MKAKLLLAIGAVAAILAHRAGASPPQILAAAVAAPLLTWALTALGAASLAATRPSVSASAPIPQPRRRARRDLAAIDAMTGEEFEDFVAEAARAGRLPVIMTGATGDWGVDLVVGHRPDRLAIQCKRQSRPVGSAAVQEVVAGAPMQDCARTMVVTNQGFTAAARRLAEMHDCTLVGRRHLAVLADHIRRAATRELAPRGEQ